MNKLTDTHREDNETIPEIPPRSILNAMEEAIHVVDDKLRIIFFNTAFQRWNEELGLPSTNITGKNIFDVFPFLSDAVLDEYRDVFETGEKRVTEEESTVEGQTIYTETQKIPVIHQGDVIQVVTIIRDITAQKTAKQQLKESEALHRGVVDNANDAIYVITPQGFEFVNPSFEALTGYSETEVTDASFDFWDLLHPDDHELILQREQARERGDDIPSRYEFRIIDKTGNAKTVEATTVDIGQPGQPRVMGILRDITERVHMEAALQQANDKNMAILQALPDLMFILSRDGTYLEYYAPHEEKLAIPPAEIIGKNICDIGLSDREVQQIQDSIATVLDEHTIEEIEYTLEVQAGRRVFDARIAPLTEDSVLSIVRDITDLTEARERVEEVNEVLRLTNKIMRHDILNDLQVARSALDIYQDENDQEFLQKAASRLEQSVSLVKQVQELERVTTGRELQSYRVREVIQDVMDADINCYIEGDCTVQADAALPSVIDNLIENAVIHGGSEHIEITMHEHDDVCEIRVADDGTGIPNEIKESVFGERFSYGGSAGSGLGLYIVQKAIERYGGTVHIEDNQPTGTIVVIKLPKATS